MGNSITLSDDRKALLDALLSLSDEETQAIAGFAKLLFAEPTKAICEAFIDDIVSRGTGLPSPELNAFCDKIEKEFLRNERAG